jgi:hypothetical protein
LFKRVSAADAARVFSIAETEEGYELIEAQDSTSNESRRGLRPEPSIEWPKGELPIPDRNSEPLTTRGPLRVRGVVDETGERQMEFEEITPDEFVGLVTHPDENHVMGAMTANRAAQVAHETRIRAEQVLRGLECATIERRASSTVDFVAGILPKRIADEELGDLLEIVRSRASKGDRALAYARLVYGVILALVHSLVYLSKSLIQEKAR